MEIKLLNSDYFLWIEYEEAIEIVSRYMAEPPLNNKFKEYHSKMLDEAVKRNIQGQDYVKAMMGQALDTGPFLVKGMSHGQLLNSLFRDMYGLGAIEELVEDETVQEINVNGFDNIWFEKGGVKRRAEDLSFTDDTRLKQIIDRCLPSKEVNRLTTFAQSNFDGARVYIGVPPAAKKPYLNYRKFSVFEAGEESYLRSGTITEEALEVLKLSVRHRANINIIGPQNTGKTTLLSFLTDYYPPSFRIGVLESPEFETTIENRRPKGNVFFLKTEEKLGIDELEVFKHALRFSADVLIIPEARGAEMEEVIKAQRRGNRGSMSTAHSLSPGNLVDDIILMISESNKPYQLGYLKMLVAKSLDIVITMHLFAKGERKIINISEVDYDDTRQEVVVNELFVWENNDLVRTANPLRRDLSYSLQFHGAQDDELKKWGLL